MVFNFSININRFLSAYDIKNRYENNSSLMVEGSTLSNNQSKVCSIREHDSILYYRSTFDENPMFLRIKLRHDDVYITCSFSNLEKTRINYAYGHCLTILNNFFPEACGIKDEDSELNIGNMIDFVKTFGFVPAKKMFGIGKLVIEDSSTTILHTTGLRRVGGSDLLMLVNNDDSEYAISLLNLMGLSIMTGEWDNIHETTFKAAKSLSGSTLSISLVELDAASSLKKDYSDAKEILEDYANNNGAFYVPVSSDNRGKVLLPMDYVSQAHKTNMQVRLSNKEIEEFDIASKKFMPLVIETLDRGEEVKIFFYDRKNKRTEPLFFTCTANAFDYKEGYFIGTDLDGKNRCISEEDVYYWKASSFSPLSIPSTVKICAMSIE